MKRLRVAALLLSATATATATPVVGRLVSPAGTVPALRVYAWSAGGRLVAAATAPGQTTFRFDLPAGQYRFFATPADPGVPLVYAGHTGCGGRADGSASCARHDLLRVAVGGDAAVRLDIDDWRIDGAQAEQLDRALHRPDGAGDADPATGAPRFFEYPAEPLRRARVTVLDTATVPAADRRELQAALDAGHINFAGRATVVPVACGPACSTSRVLDLATGRSSALPTADVGGQPACSNHYAYRRDSRLLRVGYDNGDGEPGDAYFVWEPDSGQWRSVGSAAAGRCAPRTVADR